VGWLRRWWWQVDYSTTPEELQEFFASCGVVNRITILCDKFTGHPKGYAYVVSALSPSHRFCLRARSSPHPFNSHVQEFKDADSVQNALLLNDSEFKGRPLKVSVLSSVPPPSLALIAPASRPAHRSCSVVRRPQVTAKRTNVPGMNEFRGRRVRLLQIELASVFGSQTDVLCRVVCSLAAAAHLLAAAIVPHRAARPPMVVTRLMVLPRAPVSATAASPVPTHDSSREQYGRHCERPLSINQSPLSCHRPKPTEALANAVWMLLAVVCCVVVNVVWVDCVCACCGVVCAAILGDAYGWGGNGVLL
jgi:hypothetical protein